MAEWILLALWISPHSTAVQPTLDHLRSAEPHIRTLIADGYMRSATFKEVVDVVEERSCVVYVASVVKLSQGARGALLHEAVGLPEMPILRVLLKTNLSGDEAIAVIGHELQHVAEAISGAPKDIRHEIATAFDKLDPTARSAGVRKYETDAAIAITTKIRDELRRHRQTSTLSTRRATLK